MASTMVGEKEERLTSANPQMRELMQTLESVVQKPEFAQYFQTLQSACHGPLAGPGNCYWCFQIATGAKLPTSHAFLAVPVVNGAAQADENGDPVTADGKTHPWDAESNRILCPHCLGQGASDRQELSENNVEGSKANNQLRHTPMSQRRFLTDLGRPEMTPEELFIYQALPPKNHTPEAVEQIRALVEGLAGHVSKLLSKGGGGGRFSADDLMDDLQFTFGFLQAFEHGKSEYGGRFTVVTAVVRVDENHVSTMFHPLPYGTTSNVAEPKLRKIYGKNLIGIIAQQLEPGTPRSLH